MDHHDEPECSNIGKKIKITYFDLFEFLRGKGPLNPQSIISRKSLLLYINSIYNEDPWEDEYENKILNKIRSFSIMLSKKWTQSNGTYSKFTNNNEVWLKTEFILPEKIIMSNNSFRIGRPITKFNECVDRTKNKKIQTLIKSYTSPELTHAVCTKFQKSGNRSMGKLLKEANTTPTRANTILKTYKNTNNLKPVPYTEDGALAFLIENKLSKQQYINIRLGSKKRNCDIYPPYDKIMAAKKRCYPDNLIVSESGCYVPLQDLLDHTTKRIFELPTIPQINSEMTNFELIYKWGCDGSSGQAQYKIKFDSSTSSSTSDIKLFIFSLVPIQLRCLVEGETAIIWQNPRTSSTRYCRTIKFMFKKETAENTIQEVNAIEIEIQKSSVTAVSHSNINLKIKHQLIFSMVDGKVCNSITGTSSQTCYICGSTPKNNNDIDKIKAYKSNSENYRYGLSTLHAWIRFFECVLHIAYRLEFKTWQVRSDENKIKLSERKKEIQNKFRSEMGLLVDIVLQGHGTTNDGNTARKFFKNPNKSAEITGVDLNLITRFGNILIVMASGQKINIDAFDHYCTETARLYVSLYPWYYMPSSVHKILLHGADVINNVLLPIGQLSEEAQECMNKNYKVYREHHTRKNSRFNSNEDLFHNLLISSDPVISTIQNIPSVKKEQLPPEVKLLLMIESNNLTLEECDVSEYSNCSNN